MIHDKILIEARSGYWQPLPGQVIWSRSLGYAVTTKQIPPKGHGLAVAVYLPNGDVDVLPINDVRSIDRPRLKVVTGDGSLRDPAKRKRVNPRRVEQRELFA